MAKLTQEVLDKIVERVVPEEYRPPPKGKAGLLVGANTPPPVTNIDVDDTGSFLVRLVDLNPGIDLLRGPVRAYHVNWGKLRQRAKDPNYAKHLKSSGIWVDEACGDLPMLKMEFIVLHEIGHVDWLRRPEETSALWKDSEEERYADLYACEQLTGLYGETLAKKMLKEFGTSTQADNRDTFYDA